MSWLLSPDIPPASNLRKLVDDAGLSEEDLTPELRGRLLGEQFAAQMRTGLPAVPSPIVTTPTVLNGRVYGFTEAGQLVEQKTDGTVREILPHDAVPEGTAERPLFSARRTLYGHSFVADANGRVLGDRHVEWKLDVTPHGGLIPAGDSLAMYLEDDRTLVFLAGPSDDPDAR